MSKLYVLSATLCLLFVSPALVVAETAPSWLEMPLTAALTADDEAPAETEAAPSLPIPLHTIEAASGGVITPMAYIVNGGSGKVVGMPSTSYTYLDLGSKESHVFAVTMPVMDRIELGYSVNNFSIGSLGADLKKLGLSAGRDDVWLHTWTVRGNLLAEDSFDLPLPAVTAGVQFKYNEGINKIDGNIGGALTNLGLDDNFGVDYTLTSTKMFPTLAFGRPVVATAGMRLSQASQIGLLGFGNAYRATFEGNVACLPTDWLMLAYEYRQKKNPYREIDGLLGNEDDWSAFSATWMVNENLTISGVYGLLGNVANARADNTLAVQVKWEF